MPNHEYARYRNYPKSKWRWPNFTPKEMASKGDGKLMIDPESMDKLQELRDRIGKPFVITSAYRSREHNAAVGGAKNSYHMKAKAFDIKMEGHDPALFEREARRVGFTGFGFYQRQNFMHIDTGPAREWGNRWFVKPVSEEASPPLPVPPRPMAKPPSPSVVDQPSATSHSAKKRAGLVAIIAALGAGIGAWLLGLTCAVPWLAAFLSVGCGG